ncbi:hypothetical protein FRC05_011013 [Tulasnella sp. 425]|nr:hypothetical protein FRC05_011013 [Tulasnella sp. 425]
MYRRRGTTAQSLPYPPGPRPFPILGNILEMPQSKFAIAYTRLGEKYGPLTWLTIPGQNILVVNSYEAAKELLEKRAVTFADRPRFTMLNEVLGLSDYFAFTGYNNNWRKQRAYLKVPLSAPVVKRDYSALLEVKAQEYLERCFVRPENFLAELNRTVAETTTKLTYGRLEDRRGRDYIQLSYRVVDIFVIALQGYVVDLLPALQYLPSWLPGMRFKRDAATWRKEINDLEEIFFESAKENMLSDEPEARLSYMSKGLEGIHQKYGEGTDVQQRSADEMALARSGLQFFTGK